MNYRYFSLSIISFICGLLFYESKYFISFPLMCNVIFYTYNFLFIVGFILLGIVIWKLFAICLIGFAYCTGYVQYIGNEKVIIEQTNRSDIPRVLHLKYQTKSNQNSDKVCEPLKVGDHVSFFCFFNNKYGKLIKLYNKREGNISFSSKLREYVKSILNQSKHKDFLYGIILGDRSFFPMDVVKHNGLFHFFAIAGLHMSIAIVNIEKIVRFLFNLSFVTSYYFNPILISKVISLLFGLMYSLISFNSVSSVRALVVIFLAFLIPSSNRLKILIVAAFLMLLYSPVLVLSKSFQMSFLATFAVLSGNYHSLNINIMMLPFINILNPFSIILNFIAIPIFSYILTFTFICIFIPFFIPILDIMISFFNLILMIKVPVLEFTLSKASNLILLTSVGLTVLLNQFRYMYFVTFGLIVLHII